MSVPPRILFLSYRKKALAGESGKAHFTKGSCASPNVASVELRQIRMRPGIFDEFTQALHDGRPHEELAEDVDLAA